MSREALLAAVRAGDLDEARRLAVAALAQPDVDRGQLHALIGRLELQRGRPELALPHLEQARALQVADPAVLQLLGELVGQTEPVRGLSLLTEAARGGGPQQALALAEALAAQERPADSLPWFQIALQDPELQTQALVGLCQAAVAAQEPERAGQALALLLDLGPEDEILRGLAELAADLPLPPPVPDRWLDRAEPVLPPGTCHLLRAHRAVRLRDPEAGLRHARAALDLNPHDQQAARMTGECLILTGQVEQAEAWLDQAPVPPETTLALADALRARGKLAEAARRVQALTERLPHHAGALVELSRLLADLGRDREAEAAIERAMALDPKVDQQGGRTVAFLRQVLVELPELLHQVEPQHGDWRLLRVRLGHNALLLQVDQPDGTERFVKILLPGRRSRAHAEATADLEARLAQTDFGLQVPLPLPDTSGARVLACAGGLATVLTAVPGVSLRRTLRDPRQDLMPGHARSLGRSLGRLQRELGRVDGWNRSSDEGLSSGLQTVAGLLADPDGWRQEALALGLPGRHAALSEAIGRHLDRWLPRLAQVRQGLAGGIVHGDFGWHNATWAEAEVVGLVDFDYAAVDVPLTDLANAVHRCAADWKRLTVRTDPQARPEIASALLHGWGEVAGRLPLESPSDFEALLIGVRVAYYLSMARASLREDPRSPGSYGPVAEILTHLRHQLDWLDQGGLRQLVPLEALRPLLS